MKPPKNFYSNLDRMKQGLPEVPEASATDSGKIIKVGSDGSYELGTMPEVPSITLPTQRTEIMIGTPTSITHGSVAKLHAIETSGGNCSIRDYRNMGSIKGSDLSFYEGSNIQLDFKLDGRNRSYLQGQIIKKDARHFIVIAIGFADSHDTNPIRKLVDITFSDLDGTAFTYTATDIGFTKYFEIESSGSSVSLPSGVTFADVYTLLQAGVDVKFTDGARVFSVTAFESTNIRAHWMSDLDLTSMEVYVINLASDGTGTVASATFSGS